MKRSTIVALAALAFFAVPNLTSAMPTNLSARHYNL